MDSRRQAVQTGLFRWGLLLVLRGARSNLRTCGCHVDLREERALKCRTPYSGLVRDVGMSRARWALDNRQDK